MNRTFENRYCNGSVDFVNEFDVIVTLHVNKNNPCNTIRFIAPAPAKHNSSFTGSGLPYASKEQAYDLTPNIGVLKCNQTETTFKIKMKRPNSYYEFDEIIHPTLKLLYDNNDEFDIPLHDETIPYRSLGYPMLRKKQKEAFYHRQLPIRSQEQIIRDSEFPIKEDPSFWGLKPPK